MNFLKASKGQFGKTGKAVSLKTFTGFTAVVDSFDRLTEELMSVYSL